jgi:NADH-quinone oxidoreductase subunit C
MSANYPPEVAEKIKAQFPDAVQDIITFRGEVTLVVDPEHIVEVATTCRDTPGLAFNMLFDLAGVDYWPEQPRFAVAYTLFSLMHNHFVRLKVYTPGSKPTLPTITGVWPGAQWPEREVYDMFGITFEGHPDMRRILLPYDWTGHPLRKDYPLGYEEVQFSFNYDRVQSKKPHPGE